ILDLKEFNFPLFSERWGRIKEQPAGMAEFVQAIVEADGVIIVTPVYNGSFAAAAKNAIDILYAEWRHKPVAIYSGTYTPTPGIAAVQQLQAIMLKLGALVAPALGTFINMGTELAEDGTPVNPDKFIPMMRPPVDELLWMIDRK
ncbi:MAG: NAD(P)H-dependent oxidoreductase, partial [Rikenellaceae bacterium]|nr:NAD(P)H-dependent oxidoreductase [Rikenellaceae bacterium]